MIQLTNKKISLTVTPEMGMALVSFKIYNKEILNQNLNDDFLKIRKGLGPIIFPHFSQASPISYGNDKPSHNILKIFPHIRHLRELGISHPFQHGIGRYVQWDYHINNDSITGYISGDDKINGIRLKELTRFNFNGKISYELFQDYLNIKMQIFGEMPVASGIHFYYDSVDENSFITLNAYKGNKKIDLITLNSDHKDFLKPITKEGDGFSECVLNTAQYQLVTRFTAEGNLENSFDSLVIFSSIEKRFVCIEPISYDVTLKNTKTNFLGEIQLIPNLSILN